MTEAEIRAAHPDWTDEQVAAELAKQPEPAAPPAPPPSSGSGDHDAAMARMRREKDEADKRAKAAEDKLAAEERKKAEEQGEYQKLADQEKARADKLEAEKNEERAKVNAEKTASGLKFKDTGYALYLLAADNIDLSDPAAVKAALEQIATDRKDLVSGIPPPPSGGPAGGSDGKPPGLTREQLAGMSPAAIAKLDPEVVNKALAG